MSNIKLKSLISERITEIQKKEARATIEEAFDYDLQESMNGEINEAFFDTVKHLGKNAVESLKNAWKTAKEQGNVDQQARIKKKIEKLQAQHAKLNPKASGGKTGAPAEKGNEKQKAAQANPKARQQLATNIITKLFNQLKTKSPEVHQKVVAALAQGKAAIEKLQAAPVIAKKEKEVEKKIANAQGNGLGEKVNAVAGDLTTPVDAVAAIVTVAKAAKIPDPIQAIVAGTKNSGGAASQPPVMQQLPPKLKTFIDKLNSEQKKFLLQLIG